MLDIGNGTCSAFDGQAWRMIGVHRKPIPGGVLDGPGRTTTCSTLCQILRSLIWRKHQKLRMDPNLLSNSPRKIAQAMLAFLILLGSHFSGYNFEAWRWSPFGHGRCCACVVGLQVSKRWSASWLCQCVWHRQIGRLLPALLLEWHLLSNQGRVDGANFKQNRKRVSNF